MLVVWLLLTVSCVRGLLSTESRGTMRNFFLIPFCSLLLAAAACGSEPSEPGDPGGGEIRSQADVQRLFEAIMPDLVEAFTALANDLAPSALSSSTDKSSHTSSIQCPGGGTLEVDPVMMQGTLTACSAGGVTISATLFLAVFPLGPSMYGANFRGPLMVSGSFNGTVEVIDALVEWTDPPSANSTFWDVTVTVNGQTFTVSSEGGGSGSCEPVEVPANSGARDAPCDDDGDCQSTCRGSNVDPSEACTCRPPDDGGSCPVVDVTPGSIGFGGDCDDNADCEGGLPCIDCVCI